jgi:broad specificity phosphatase PhoE
MIRLILIRHGRTAWNALDGPGQRFRGIIDLPLAQEGVAQAQATAERLAHLPLKAIYTSPLNRSTHTADLLAEPHGLAPQPHPGLGSMDYGDWAGQLTSDVAHHWPSIYQAWQQNPFSVQVPGGESAQELRERAVTAVHQILSYHDDGETIGLVSHQVVTKSLVCSLLGLPGSTFWRFGQDLCNLTCFDYDPAHGQFILTSLNDTCHLSSSLPGTVRGTSRLLLLRHGQTAWNVGAGEERFRGRTDLPLDDTGISQAGAIASRLRNQPISAIYASPLQRTRQTIAPLAAQHSLPIQSHEGLLDIDYGHLQGLTLSEAKQTHAELEATWRTTPARARFPMGEGLVDVQARVLSLLDDMTTHHPGATVILAGHQIVNRVLVCTLLGLDMDRIWHIQQDTAGINLFQEVEGTWQTLTLNDTCHLV